MVSSAQRLLLLGPTDVSPTRGDFEVVGAFNPGVVRVRDEVVLLVRVAERPMERRAGFRALPRWDVDQGLVVDWERGDEWEDVDPRVVRRRADGTVRLTFTSHLRVVRCGDGRRVREVGCEVFVPEGELEEFGVEDARITLLEGRFWITYVAVSRHGPATALASTVDFRSFERHGVIFCPENKDVVLFPERVGGRYAALHRPVCRTSFTRPEIWFATSPDMRDWGGHMPVRLGGGEWQSGRVGAGAPPLRVREGWLAIYHGNGPGSGAGGVGIYSAGVMLLDAGHPARVLKSSAGPIWVPEAEYEVEGFVPNVVFPTGVVVDGERVLVYGGAADTSTTVYEVGLGELLDALEPAQPG